MSSPSSPKHSSSSRWDSLLSFPSGIQTTFSHTGSNSDSDEGVAAFSDTSNTAAEQKQTVASDSEAEDSTSGKRQRKRIHFNVEQLQTVYHLPLKTAAERLGVCEAALKRICRRNHVHKWPYRQLSSVRRRIAELKDRYAAMVSGDEGGGGTDVLTLEDAHSVLGLTDALPVVRNESFDRRGGQRDSVSVTPAQFHDKLQRLEEEKDQIILSAHQQNRPSDTVQPELMMEDALMPHLHDRQSNLSSLDLNQFDRDFPLLFLANLWETPSRQPCHSDQGWLDAPRPGRVPDEREGKRKRSRTYDDQFTQIVEGVLDEKNRQRELRRLRQLRYWKKKDELVKTLEEDTKQLQVEINELRHRHQAILSASPASQTVWNVIAQYFHLFRHGYQPPTSPTTGLAPSCTQLDFMRATMDANILHDSGRGVEALLVHWKKLSVCFGNVECRLITLEQSTEDWVVATSTMSCTITETTVANVFPHLSTNAGYCRSPLVDKLVGRRIVVKSSKCFEWDCAFGRIVRIIDQSDLIAPMLNLLGNLEDVSTVFSKACIGPDFRFA